MSLGDNWMRAAPAASSYDSCEEDGIGMHKVAV